MDISPGLTAGAAPLSVRPAPDIPHGEDEEEGGGGALPSLGSPVEAQGNGSPSVIQAERSGGDDSAAPIRRLQLLGQGVYYSV